MVKLTKSLEKWLWDNHRDKIAPIMFGHVELFTEEMQRDYIAWCKMDEGRQYLKGGSKYKPDPEIEEAMNELPMDIRPIDANALRKKRRVYIETDARGYSEHYRAVPMEAIDSAPTLDVAPVVHAKWDNEHRCTECICLCTTVKTPQGHLAFIETAYCPNCGARMDGGAE